MTELSKYTQFFEYQNVIGKMNRYIYFFNFYFFLVPLSPNAWKMSFAMFLLILTFESKMVRRKVIKCDHSLHNSQITCFGKCSTTFSLRFIVDNI